MLNLENFDEQIIAGKRIAAVFFTAEWCKPSRLQQQIIAELQQEFAASAIIEVLDVDQHEKLADRFNCRTLPTAVLFAQGEIVEILPGYQTLDFIQSYLRHLIKLDAENSAKEKNEEKPAGTD